MADIRLIPLDHVTFTHYYLIIALYFINIRVQFSIEFLDFLHRFLPAVCPPGLCRHLLLFLRVNLHEFAVKILQIFLFLKDRGKKQCYMVGWKKAGI